MAKNIMIQGTMSNAGKSLLCAALCRIFRQDGYTVAPFKSQNMALNSFITASGGEIGRAQAVQAEAAGIAPDTRMNPVLLKPTTDVGSQVIVNGRVFGNMAAAEYYRRKRELVPHIMEAYKSLSESFDIIVIEGAGSPAEINLRQEDIVNMGLAEMVDAPVFLAGDIDRGGVFAQLYGTVALLEPKERARIKGVIINKFRGDKAILEPGLRQLEELCGVPVAGVVPYLDVDIDDEDSLTERFSKKTGRRAIDIAVIRLPRISNFTDFSPFERYENVSLRYVDRLSDLKRPDLIFLPGTK
ncbi:MAG: cobyric acid synthase, partial [Oscillospiraceae bacterium]|nr:cobyric acid synthase [Oscillospiraceae bacterium]